MGIVTLFRMTVQLDLSGHFPSVRTMEKKQFLHYNSCKTQRLLEEAEAFEILKDNKMNERDLKLVKRYLQVETIIERPVIITRPASKCLVLFMEHIKLICFKDFCLILSPLENWTNKFIQEELNCIESDHNGNSSEMFAFQILEKALESVMKKFRKNLKLIKPPLNNLLYMIETVPSINGLKMLLALKKTLSHFQKSVENVAKVLKVCRSERDSKIKFSDNQMILEELEQILDFFVADIEEIEAEVHMVMDLMEDTDQFVSTHQDNVRNELMKMGLIIDILAVTMGFGAVVGGIFGMNLENHIENSSTAFTYVVVGMILFMLFMFGGFILKYYLLKQDTSKAQSYNVLRNFFRYAELLEFQKFPDKNIKKQDFIDSVSRVTGKELNDKDADFLFGMVDRDGDGVISTETELILEIEQEKFLK